MHHDEAYIDGPSNSTLPDHWRNFSEAAAAAAARGSSSNTAGGSGGRRAGLSHQDSQVLGLTGTAAAAAAQPAGADGGRVSVAACGGCIWGGVGGGERFTAAAEWCGVESEVGGCEGVVCSKHGMRCWGLCTVAGSGGQFNRRAGWPARTARFWGSLGQQQQQHSWRGRMEAG